MAAGRTLVVFAGPNVSPAEYNRLFMDPFAAQGGLLPARLKEKVGDAVLRTTVEKVTQVQGQSPYLDGLVESADLYQDILVYSYIRTEAAPADAVLARLAGGDPLLLEKPFGQGHVILCTTAVTTQWSNLPLRNLFLPLVMRMVFLSSRAQAGPSQILAGQVYQANLAPAVKAATTVEVSGPLGPSGEVATELRDTRLADGRNLLRFEKTWNLGYYGWRAPSKRQAASFARTLTGPRPTWPRSPTENSRPTSAPARPTSPAASRNSSRGSSPAPSANSGSTFS